MSLLQAKQSLQRRQQGLGSRRQNVAGAAASGKELRSWSGGGGGGGVGGVSVLVGGGWMVVVLLLWVGLLWLRMRCPAAVVSVVFIANTKYVVYQVYKIRVPLLLIFVLRVDVGRS